MQTYLLLKRPDQRRGYYLFGHQCRDRMAPCRKTAITRRLGLSALATISRLSFYKALTVLATSRDVAHCFSSPFRLPSRILAAIATRWFVGCRSLSFGRFLHDPVHQRFDGFVEIWDAPSFSKGV